MKKMLISVYDKFIQDNRCQILYNLTKFYRRHYKKHLDAFWSLGEGTWLTR